MASGAALMTDHFPHGEGLIALQLFTELARRGHDVVVCARRTTLTEDPGFTAIETGMASTFPSIEPLAYARKVQRIFASLGGWNRFSATHWLFPQGADELLFRPPGSLPFVVGPHSKPWPSSPSTPWRRGDYVRLAARPWFALAHRSALKRANVLLASTPAATSVFPPRLQGKVEVLPFGVAVERFPPRPLPDEPSILFIGRLERQKGVRALVEAFVLVRREFPEARLVLAGEGSERSWVEEQRQILGLGRSLVLLGAVPHDGVPDLLTKTTILCHPARGEPFGMAVLEAMAAARPVVALDSGGPAFLLDGDRSGRLVPSGEPHVLGRALLELLRDPARLTALGAYNRSRVRREFSLARVASRLEELYTPPDEIRRRSRTGRSGSRRTVSILMAAAAESANGILDHTRKLADALEVFGGCEVSLYPFGEAEISDLARCDMIIVQYNPFMYGRWGFAPGLPTFLHRLRSRRSNTISVIVHEPYVPIRGTRSALMGVWQRLQLVAVSQAADVVFASTEHWTSVFSKRWPRRPVFHLPVGSNLPDMRHMRGVERTRLGMSETDIALAAFGTGSPSRHLGYIVSAANAVARVAPTTLLHLGRGAPALDGLDSGVKLHVPGPLTPARLAGQLGAADIFLAPLVDGISTRRTTLMAALQHGLAVVGTDGPLTGAVFREAADGVCLVPVDRPDFFIDSVLRLTKCRERREEVSAAGRELYEREFDWPVLVERLLEGLGAR